MYSAFIFSNLRLKMIQIGDVVVSFDVLREKFLCDLNACKGACCVEGDAGAPVELDEIEKLEEVLPVIWDELSPEAHVILEKQGVVYTDCEGDLVTSIVNNKDCVFTCYDEKGCCYCAIEKAYREGKTDFYKPVSCHLYPIRVGNYGGYKAVNYNRWDVCKAAVLLGRKKNLPVYKFLKEPLIRKFGEDWYAELDLSVPRNEQGHRYYTKENIEQFQKIKDLKEKGYQLKAIKMLLHEEQPLLETEPQPKEKAKAKEKPQVPAATAQPQMAQVTHITKQRVQSSKIGADEKMEQFQNLMTGIVKRAIEENNQALGLAVGEQVGERVLKEMNYLAREQEEQAEERYRRLDEAIRQHHKSKKLFHKKSKDKTVLPKTTQLT